MAGGGKDGKGEGRKGRRGERGVRTYETAGQWGDGWVRETIGQLTGKKAGRLQVPHKGDREGDEFSSHSPAATAAMAMAVGLPRTWPGSQVR